jgi:hypothetical protein
MSSTDSQVDVSAALRQALMACAAGGLSGVLRVTGDPGGTIHLAGGTVAAIETPGAPGPEVLLLRSHRVAESDWDAAFTATAAVGGPMPAELVARGLLGAGELEALLRTALADAMFVLASGRVEECGSEPGTTDCLLPLDPGVEADWLLGEANRRAGVLASVPFPPGQARVAAAPGAVSPDIRLGDGRDEILALADGRRTPRDMAFALGRGVYATMLQVAGMREAGLLVTVPFRPVPPPGPSAAHQPHGGKPALPHRTRDRPGLPRRVAQPGQPGGHPDWTMTAPMGLLRPRTGHGAEPGERP